MRVFSYFLRFVNLLFLSHPSISSLCLIFSALFSDFFLLNLVRHQLLLSSDRGRLRAPYWPYWPRRGYWHLAHILHGFRQGNVHGQYRAVQSVLILLMLLNHILIIRTCLDNITVTRTHTTSFLIDPYIRSSSSPLPPSLRLLISLARTWINIRKQTHTSLLPFLIPFTLPNTYSHLLPLLISSHTPSLPLLVSSHTASLLPSPHLTHTHAVSCRCTGSCSARSEPRSPPGNIQIPHGHQEKDFQGYCDITTINKVIVIIYRTLPFSSVFRSPSPPSFFFIPSRSPCPPSFFFISFRSPCPSTILPSSISVLQSCDVHILFSFLNDFYFIHHPYLPTTEQTCMTLTTLHASHLK